MFKSVIVSVAVLVSVCGSYVGYQAVKKSKATHVEASSTTQSKKLATPDTSNPPKIEMPSTTAAPISAGSTEVILLNSRTTVTFRGVVTPEKVADIQIRLMSLADTLDENETIYLVLDTPGGSIDAGNQLIDTVNSMPQKVKTLTVFAASMGFQFVQNMDERLIVPNGTLMSHRARFSGLQGEAPGELLVQLNFYLSIIHRLDSIAAQRMQMPVNKYQELIRDEYWVSGYEAVAQKAADRVVLARCDKSFQGNTRELLGIIFGIKVYGVMSNCPLITGILGIEVEGNGPEEHLERALEFGQSYQNRRAVVDRVN